MPYQGGQAQACYSKASSCLKAGYTPTWACEDWFYQVWDMKGGSKTTVQSGGYNTSCGAPLKEGEPTSTYQAKKLVHPFSVQAKGKEDKISYLPTTSLSNKI